ncbi:hypothetical protein C3369_12670 [Escherichia sp. ESNIH1]|nr:hypothetical protein C3369_12670 [Escherichia sp. ESNIH1]
MPGGASLPGLPSAQFRLCRPGKAEPPPGESMQTRAGNSARQNARRRKLAGPTWCTILPL